MKYIFVPFLTPPRIVSHRCTSPSGGRTIALTEEDFRKSGFRARETVAVLAGPRNLIAGRVSPLPSAALRPGNVGLASASAQSLGSKDGARVRVRPLSDTSVTILMASTVDLVLEPGFLGRVMQASPHAYLTKFTAGRKALLNRAAGFCAHGVHVREGDLLSVSFEGVPHPFRVARLRPPSRPHPTTTTADVALSATAAAAVAATNADREKERGGCDTLVAPLAGLSLSDPSAEVVPSVALASVPPSATTMEADCVSSQQTDSSSAIGNNDNASSQEEASSATDQSVRTQTAVAHEGSSLTAVAAASGGEAATIIDDHTNSGARARLEAFYGQHNPQKLAGIDGILAKYAGREEDLFAKLEKMYGAGSSLRATASEGNAATADTASATRARLEEFYQEHNPEKLDSIVGILEKYAGREKELFTKLEKMYGAGSSLRDATSGGNSGRERQQREPDTPVVASPSPARPSAYRERTDTGGPRPTPSAERQGVETPSDGGGEAGTKSWGSGETLWLITTDTSVQLLAADAPPDQLGAASKGHLQDVAADTGASETCQQGRESVQRDEEEWGSVGGLSSQVQKLKEAIQLPLRSPEVLRRYGVRPPRGVLLHGPPGTGKTTLARAAAKACGCHVIVVNGSELMSRCVSNARDKHVIVI